MPHIYANKLNYKYESNSDNTLNDLCFSISDHSQIGLIGSNGSGKSTLLKLLSKSIPPSSGSLIFEKSLKTGFFNSNHLPETRDHNKTVLEYLWSKNKNLNRLRVQIENQPNWDILAEFETKGGYSFENRISKSLGTFELSHISLSRNMHSLSGGEFIKLKLASLQLSEFDFILFDEPLNHLDAQTQNSFIQNLKNLNKPYLIASHNTKLLNSSCSSIWRLKNGLLRCFDENYQSYLTTVQKEKEALLLKLYHQKKEIIKITQEVRSRTDSAHKMEKFKRTRSIKKNGSICKRDDGSGSKKANPTKKMKSAKALEHRLQKSVEKKSLGKVFIPKERHLKLLNPRPCKSPFILQVKDLSLNFKKPVFSKLNFDLKPHEKMYITGKNGAGKTSLFKILNQKIESSSGEYKWSNTSNFAYYEQNKSFTDDNLEKSIQDFLQPYKSYESCDLRYLLDIFNLKDHLDAKLKHLSSGQLAKVHLSEIILSGANCLLLDEASNHLDLRAKDILAESLKNFTGSCLLVSHDEAFAQNIQRRHLNLESLAT